MNDLNNLADHLPLSYWLEILTTFALKVVAAFVIFIIGRFLIRVVLKRLTRLMEKRRIEPTVVSFFRSTTHAILIILLFLAILSKLGVEVVSFAALLTSAGVAIGMALSGDLKNFAGGIILLLTRPIRVDDFVECQGISGTIEEIQIFHTIIRTPDNKKVFLPNGLVSSGTITNYSMTPTRRVQWTFGVVYDTDYDKAKEILLGLISQDHRILKDPAPIISLNTLNDSSVDILVRVWCDAEVYWELFWDFNKTVYKEFNEKGIGFPFPTVTIKQ